MESRDLFEILVREHIDSVRAFLLASLRDPIAAEDLVQETFLVAWRNLHRYDRSLPFGPWARGIAGKLVLNYRRKVGRAKVQFVDEEMLGMMEGQFANFAQLPGDSFDEHLDALRDCMACLSPQQRSAIDLHYQHGLHCNEISRRLGLGLEAVKKHLQRGRAALQKCLGNKLPSLREETA
jgi:RNA polymerase sigma-70 factor (ECF subfamily)